MSTSTRDPHQVEYAFTGPVRKPDNSTAGGFVEDISRASTFQVETRFLSFQDKIPLPI
jgi:hypothetical protein